ncbi:MAG: thioredoxin-dependent thiol peroxidase [Candidatus Paceibacterota bacterium]
MALAEGTAAPAFALPDANNKTHKLSDYKGKWLLIYFYPRDFTPGCTVESCTLRDAHLDFTKAKAVVVGISADSPDRHAKFAAKHELPFTLLADEHKTVVEKYGVLVRKNIFGKKFQSIKRTSFLVDPNGNIAKIYPKVTPGSHAKEVLDDLKELQK